MTITAAPVTSKHFETMKNKTCGSQADKESWWTQLQATNPGRCGSLWRPKRNVQQYNPLRATDPELRSCLLSRMDPPAMNTVELSPQPLELPHLQHSRPTVFAAFTIRIFTSSGFPFPSIWATLALQTPSCLVWKAILQVPKWLTAKIGVNWPFVDPEPKHETL